jgi:hypothetical protein
MEIRVETPELPEIRFNFSELREEIMLAVEKYKTLVYGEDELKEAKKDRATLNKLKTALEDECKRRKAEYMKPYEDFKKKVDELCAIIKEPIAAIDKQLKEAEDKRKAEKRDEIGAYWTQIEKPAALDWLTLPKIFDETWLNATVTMRSVKDEIDGWIYRVETELKTLASLPEFSFEAIETYKMTLDINKAISEGRRLADIQKRKLEAQAQEAKPLPVVDVTPAPQAITPADADEPKMEVKFAAVMTVKQALELKAFFEARGIEFRAIKEG